MKDSVIRNQTRVESVVLVTLFLVALSLPGVGLIFKWRTSTEQEEFRPLARFPRFTRIAAFFSVFPDDFTAYFNDNFGFRPTLIHLQALAKVKLLGVSTSPRVIVGKDGWLFLSAEYSASGKHLVRPYTDQQLAAWKAVLERRRDWLARRGIRYVFTVFPRKETIYPEYLPDNFKPEEESRLDQLSGYLKKNSDFQILDLRPALWEAKRNHQVYLKTDTHWNFYGGLTACQSIINELGRATPELRLDERDYDVRIERQVGDLVRVLGLAGYLSEDSEVLDPRRPVFTSRPDSPITVSDQPVMTYVMEINQAKLPRVVMFGDSAFGSMRPFFAQSFGRLVFVWLLKMDPVLIESEKPEIVIQDLGELYLANDTIPDPTEIEALDSDGKGKTAFQVYPTLKTAR